MFEFKFPLVINGQEYPISIRDGNTWLSKEDVEKVITLLKFLTNLNDSKLPPNTDFFYRDAKGCIRRLLSRIEMEAAMGIKRIE